MVPYERNDYQLTISRNRTACNVHSTPQLAVLVPRALSFANSNFVQRLLHILVLVARETTRFGQITQ